MQGLIDLFFPKSCAACGAVHEGGPFCETCALGLNEVEEPRCPRCGEPSPGICARCQAHPPPFSRAFSPYVHEGPLARAIHRFKYEDHPELAAPLGATLAARHGGLISPGAALCAIPLHKSRFLERKYDQAELLAGALAKASGAPRLAGVLERTRATARQVGLDEASRAANVEGAFVATPAVAARRIVLVDDVLTTGATARAAAQALLAAGAAEVSVLTLARATTPA